MQLSLSLPPYTQQDPQQIKPAPDDLRNFFDTLPLGSPHDAAPLLRDALRAYNTCQLPTPDRFQLTEQFARPVKELIVALVAKYRGSGIPLSDRRTT